VDALIEIVEPPPHLFVFGAGNDVLPVLALAGSVGWNATVCGNHSSHALSERFSRAAPLLGDEPEVCGGVLDRCARPLALVMSHDFRQDTLALSALLRSRAEYIGVPGSALRLERMLDEIPALVPYSRAPVVHGPAGLDLGSETAAEIALSV